MKRWIPQSIVTVLGHSRLPWVSVSNDGPTEGTLGVICSATGEMVELPWPPEMTRVADDEESFACTCGLRHSVIVGPRAREALDEKYGQP